MSVYFKNGLKMEHMNRILPCIQYVKSKNRIHDLYTFSIPFQLRKCVFNTLRIPTYSYNINCTTLYPFTKFISKNIKVYMSKKAFVVKLPYTELSSLHIVIHFLQDHSKNFPIFVDSEFTNQNILLIQEILNQFPNTKLYFKISDLEFSYLHVEDVRDEILKTKSTVFYDRIESNFPDYYEKNMFYYTEIKEEIKGSIEFKKYFKVYDRNLGILSPSYPFPKNIQKDSIVILQ
jgi:hypothetical protein